MKSTAIVLAAGKGTRMRSSRPKVLHKILDTALISWVLRSVNSARIDESVVVVGHEKELVEEEIKITSPKTVCVHQEHQLGTGHAVKVALDALLSRDETCNALHETVVVLYGDTPLITDETLRLLIKTQQQNDADAVVLALEPDDPAGYGRVILDEKSGCISLIVEDADCTAKQREVTLCNSGVYAFKREVLLHYIEQLSRNNNQGELYLTDVIGLLAQAKKRVIALSVEDDTELLGINTQAQLASAAKSMQQRINAWHLAAGVSMLDPNLVWIGPDVTIGHDTELLPLTFLYGKTTIGSSSVIGPNSRIVGCNIGEGCVVDETIAQDSVLDDGATSGPRAYLRPHTHLKKGAKAGTHVELKNATIEDHAAVPHLSYVGDASVGAYSNLGAGTITCNYDGERKHRTAIGRDCFIGSNTMLVAPVSVGDKAVTAAGSVIVDDVGDGELALARARQTNKAHWRENSGMPVKSKQKKEAHD